MRAVLAALAGFAVYLVIVMALSFADNTGIARQLGFSMPAMYLLIYFFSPAAGIATTASLSAASKFRQ